MKYELLILWETGEKETHPYKTWKDAEKAGYGYKRAFGNQIEYFTVIEKR